MERLRYAIGILTLVATAVAGWLLLSLLSEEDRSGLFSLRLEFRNVRGLKSGGDVRYRGVRVGSVRSVELSRDGEKGLATILLDDGIEKLACQGSKFWIVVPRFGGLASGATGLETLVRDAYVAFLTPEPRGPRLPTGSLIAGLESPFGIGGEETLDPIRRGDLQMTLLVAENHSLRVGADVKLRGIRTGDVRAIELAPDGTHVRVSLRIHQRYRKTVTDSTEFWIARPRLSGALLSGMAVEDLGALLTPFVGYHTGEERGLPVPDGYQAVASGERPSVEPDVPEDALASSVAPSVPEDDDASVRIVRVEYEAEEEDWLSANDHVARSGPGLLYMDTSRRAVVVTARSLCDASYFMSDTLGSDPDIKSETIRVSVPGGSVLRAGRSWVDPNGGDLALLVLEGAAPDLPVTSADLLSFSAITAGERKTLLETQDAPSVELTEPITLSIENARGRPIVQGDKVVGVVGQVGGHDETPAIVGLSLLPPELRPGS